jgi:outer membrane lipoprotein-sorting protein
MSRGISSGIVISVVAALMLLFPGCASKTTLTPAETIPELLDRVTGITSVKYEQVMTNPESPQETVQWRVWIKGNKTRIESTYEGQTGVLIIDYEAPSGYAYDPSENIWVKMDLDGQSGEPVALNPMFSAIKWAKSILASPGAVIVGSETIDGKDCLVIESGEGEGKLKTWFWKDYGFPLRMEGFETPVEWENIEFVDSSDSVFELPAGVEIQE